VNNLIIYNVAEDNMLTTPGNRRCFENPVFSPVP